MMFGLMEALVYLVPTVQNTVRYGPTKPCAVILVPSFLLNIVHAHT